jgi:dethiobiotin synthetase
VEQFGYAFPEPISPHLASRRVGTELDLAALRAPIARARAVADIILVELPGGLFTPLTDTALNADLAADLSPDQLWLLAPDRLGVLHDVIAAARACPLRIDNLVLIAPTKPDHSTGTNASELTRFVPLPVTEVPRASVADLAAHPAVVTLAARSLRRP